MRILTGDRCILEAGDKYFIDEERRLHATDGKTYFFSLYPVSAEILSSPWPIDGFTDSASRLDTAGWKTYELAARPESTENQ